MVKNIIFVTMLVFGSIQSCFAALTAKVDRKTVHIDETLTLTINTDRPLTLAPNLNLLTSALQPISRTNFSSTSYVNGKRVVESGWRIQLIALEEGVATIPSFTINGESTKAIQIKILPHNKTNADGKPAPIFTDVKISDINPFIQQQIILTVKVSSDSDIDNAQLQPPQIENAIVRSLGEPTEYVSRLSGELYRIREYQFAIFPQAKGLVTIPPMIFQGNKIVRYQSRNPLSLLSSQSRRVRIRTEELVIDVKPAIPSAHTWLPTKNLTLTSDWRPEPSELTVGEPITRVITIEADGLDATQLPEFTMPSIDGLSWFPNPPERTNHFDGTQISSELKQRFALMPNAEGQFTLPAIEIHWFNIKTKKFETARLDALEIHVDPAKVINKMDDPLAGLVLGAPKTPAQEKQQLQSNETSEFWKILALSMVIIWVITIVAFLFSRRNSRINQQIQQLPESDTNGSVKPIKTSQLQPAATWKGIAKQIKGQSSLVAYKLINLKAEKDFENFDTFLKQLEILQYQPLVNALKRLSQAAFSANSTTVFDEKLAKLLAELDDKDDLLTNKKRRVKISPLYD